MPKPFSIGESPTPSREMPKLETITPLLQRIGVRDIGFDVTIVPTDMGKQFLEALGALEDQDKRPDTAPSTIYTGDPGYSGLTINSYLPHNVSSPRGLAEMQEDGTLQFNENDKVTAGQALPAFDESMYIYAGEPQPGATTRDFIELARQIGCTQMDIMQERGFQRMEIQTDEGSGEPVLIIADASNDSSRAVKSYCVGGKFGLNDPFPKDLHYSSILFYPPASANASYRAPIESWMTDERRQALAPKIVIPESKNQVGPIAEAMTRFGVKSLKGNAEQSITDIDGQSYHNTVDYSYAVEGNGLSLNEIRFFFPTLTDEDAKPYEGLPDQIASDQNFPATDTIYASFTEKDNYEDHEKHYPTGKTKDLIALTEALGGNTIETYYGSNGYCGGYIHHDSEGKGFMVFGPLNRYYDAGYDKDDFLILKEDDPVPEMIMTVGGFRIDRRPRKIDGDDTEYFDPYHPEPYKKDTEAEEFYAFLPQGVRSYEELCRKTHLPNEEQARSTVKQLLPLDPEEREKTKRGYLELSALQFNYRDLRNIEPGYEEAFIRTAKQFLIDLGSTSNARGDMRMLAEELQTKGKANPELAFSHLANLATIVEPGNILGENEPRDKILKAALKELCDFPNSAAKSRK